MERVDVVVLGSGPDALAAAWGAAAGGVRVILVSDRSVPRKAKTLYAARTGLLKRLGLGKKKPERTHEHIEVDGHAPIDLADGAVLAVHKGSAIDKLLVQRARKAGAEIRENAEAVHADADPEGWRIQLSAGEPIRAPILIAADGARSRLLETLGIAQAQRFTASGAEVVSFVCSTWNLEGERSRFEHMKIYESVGPLSRIEVLPGKDTVTVALGPIWRGVHRPDPDWPSPTACGTEIILDHARRRLGIEGDPISIEMQEWRLDALPAPATFDGGIVVGCAAGHRIHNPLTAVGALIATGKQAGSGAATAVLEQDWRASALSAQLGEGYASVLAECAAELAYKAHGLRKARELPDGYWRGLAATA